MDKRLQFIHHNEIFSGNTTVEAREAAIDFLTNQYFKQVTRPSLYAEPVIVRYESKETPNEPNIILAIGSKGSGSTLPTKDSEYFLIDAQGIKDDVNEKYDDIERAIAKLAFKVIDSDTLHLSKENTETGSTVSGDVKISDNIVINKEFVNNIIKKNEDGIYSYVHLDFDDKTNTFTFQVNEDVNKFSIPVIESGKYDISKECIVLTYTDGKTLDIDVDDLIGEWDTEGESSTTPIVLTKEKHTDKNTDINDRNHDHWRDILKANIRIADTKKHNILTRVNDGRELYVKGTADNIFFKDGKNVKEAIEAINTEVSSAYTGNIIFKDYANNGNYNGIAANVDVEYKKETNILVFKRSDNDGQIVRKEFKLNSAAFIDDISYDTVNEKITIRYKDEDGKEQKTDIELSNLLDDWITNSDGHNVELNKEVKAGEKDVLTADVKLTKKTNDNYQILEERDDKLYVRGTADNIVYDTEKGETVKSAFERTENELQTESGRAVSAEKALSASVDTISSTIGSGFTTLKTETITDKFTSLSGKVDNEISERRESDEKFTNSIETLTESAETANTNITNLYNGLGDDYIGNNDSHTAENTVTNRLHRLEVSATTADANIKELSSKAANLTSSAETSNAKNLELTNSASTLFEKADALDDKIDAVSGSAYFEVGDTDTVAMSKNADVTSHTVTANVKVSSKDKNTILVDGNNGLYASLDYDADRNVIIISDTNSDTHNREIQLNSVSVIEFMKYDKAREVIVIGYKSNASSSETNTLDIPVTDVLSEWKTNNNSHSVRLVRTQHTVDGTDDLSGDVVLATEGNYTDNLIRQVTTTAYDEEMKGLYVSGNEINESARGIAQEEAKAAADKALVDAKAYTDSVHETVKNEIKTAKENGVSDANAYTDNKVERYNHDLHDELSTLSASTVNQAVTTANGYTDNKVSDVDTKAQGYASNAETNSKNYADGLRQTSKDEISGLTTNLHQMITSEANERASGITDVSNRVSQETSARTAADNLLQTNINNEVSDRTAADSTLQSHIDTEAQNRSNEDSKLNTAISNETTAREQADNSIRTDFGASDTALDNKITAETAERITDTKTLSDKIAKEVTDRTSADATTLQSAKDYSDSKDTELKTELKTYADDHISAASLNGGATNTARVTIKDKLVTSDVIVSAMEGNIIKKSEDVAKGGIYANPASLTYQSATNSLTFTDENGVEKIIQLNSASFINSIKKSENGKSIIISYSDTSGGTHTVDISLQDLIDALAVDNIDKTINISIVKEDRNGISTNVLSAEANIANNTDEVLNLLTTTKKDGKGELLVNGKPIYDAIDKVKGNADSLSGLVKTIIVSVGLNGDGSKKGAGDNIQKELDDTQKGAGLADDGQYIANNSAKYVLSAKSLADADNILDSRLYNLSSITLDLSATTVNQGKDLQEELDAAEIGAFGANTDKSFKYAPIPNSNYINDATSLISADDLLDKAIKKVSGDVTNVKTDNEGISADVKSLQAEIDRIEIGSGLDEQGNYIPSDKPYISGATSLTDADNKLANAVASVDKSISNLAQGSKTYSVNVFTEKDDNTNASLLKADVRLSVANGQDESELTRTEMPNGNNYEGNLLQIVKASAEGSAIGLGEKINGLYFGGSIDYGMMEGDDNING